MVLVNMCLGAPAGRKGNPAKEHCGRADRFLADPRLVDGALTAFVGSVARNDTAPGEVDCNSLHDFLRKVDDAPASRFSSCRSRRTIQKIQKYS